MKHRSLAVAVLFCLVAALLPAVASAHDGETEEYTYEVQVDKTREVDVYNFVPKKVAVNKTREVPVYGYVTEDVYNFVPKEVQVNKTREVPVYRYYTVRERVAPFWEKYTYKPPCETVIISGQAGTYCPPSQTKYRAVFNYKTVTKKVKWGTRTETYTVTETQMVWEKTGTRQVRKQTGTRTETYVVHETQMVWKKTGTRTETYTDTETRTGTRTVHDPRHPSHCSNPAYANTYPQDCGNGGDGSNNDGDGNDSGDGRGHDDDPGNPNNDDNVVCPAGYQRGSAPHGGEPPYAAPSGKFWSSATATTPVTPTNTCWQLRTGGCPTGQTKARALYSQNPNRLLLGYADLPQAPDGKKWNQESANADYACYKLVENDRTSWNDIGSGIRDVVVRILEMRGESELVKARSYQALDKVIHVYICSPPAQVGSTAGGSAAGAAIAKATQSTIQGALKAAGLIGATVSVVHIGYCAVPRSDSDSDGGDSDGGDSDGGDKMTRDDLNRAQKRFSDGEISVDEYKAIVFRWNCQQYGRFCDR